MLGGGNTLLKLTIGNTHTLKYEFKDSQNCPLPITTPIVVIYDPTGLEITQSTSYTLTEGQPGTWLLVLVTPNVTPFVTIELSVVYETQTHLTRDRYETVFIDPTTAGSEPIPVLVKSENTYLTLDEAKTLASTTYCLEGILDLPDSILAKLLIHTTELIDSLPLRGDPLHYEQLLAFPRVSVIKYVDPIFWGNSTNTVPLAVLKALLWESLALSEPQNPRSKLYDLGIKSIKVKDAEEVYRDNYTPSKLASKQALELLNPWLRGGYYVV